MHTKYLTTGYHVSGEKYTPEGQLSGHITAFPKPLPAPVMTAFFPCSDSILIYYKNRRYKKDLAG